MRSLDSIKDTVIPVKDVFTFDTCPSLYLTASLLSILLYPAPAVMSPDSYFAEDATERPDVDSCRDL